MARKQKTVFEGSMVALITPFRKGKVDEKALRRMVQFQIKNGTDALVPCGTTGESATLSHAEHRRVVEVVIEAAEGRVPIIAGTGSNSTEEAISLTRHAYKSGADAALLITPYYNRPTQEGLFRHFQAVAKAVDIPIILYNVPSRTGVNLEPATVARLSQIPSMVALKDAASNLRQTADTIEMCEGRISLLSGDDFLLLPMLAIGARGGIAVIANVVPDLMAELWDAWLAGNWERTKAIHYRIHPLNRCMYLETNPIPVKWAAYKMGLCTREIRLPLTSLAEKFQPQLEQEMTALGLLS
jgi:4-hydroxy-tetrahydrodipicolinate synthase